MTLDTPIVTTADDIRMADKQRGLSAEAPPSTANRNSWHQLVDSALQGPLESLQLYDPASAAVAHTSVAVTGGGSGGKVPAGQPNSQGMMAAGLARIEHPSPSLSPSPPLLPPHLQQQQQSLSDTAPLPPPQLMHPDMGRVGNYVSPGDMSASTSFASSTRDTVYSTSAYGYDDSVADSEERYTDSDTGTSNVAGGHHRGPNGHDSGVAHLDVVMAEYPGGAGEGHLSPMRSPSIATHDSGSGSSSTGTVSSGVTVRRTNTQRQTLHAQLAPPRPNSMLVPSPVGPATVGIDVPLSRRGSPFAAHAVGYARSANDAMSSSPSVASLAAAVGLPPPPTAPFAHDPNHRRRRSSVSSVGSNGGGGGRRIGVGARTSFTLTQGGDAALAMYRETAKRTNDTNLQMEFAKYLLETAQQPLLPMASAAHTSPSYATSATDSKLDSSNFTTSSTSNHLSPYTPYSSTGSRSMVSLSGTGNDSDQDDIQRTRLHSKGSSGALRVPSQHTRDTGPGVPVVSEQEQQRSLQEEAIWWINRLSKANHPEACAIKGHWHQHGLYGVMQSDDKALSLYTTAYKHGHPRACYRLGQLYEKKRENAKALQYYTRASSQNDALANLRLGKAHLHGELKQSRDYTAALRFLRRASDAAAAADLESHEAPFLLAQLIGDLHPTIRLPADLLAHDPSGARVRFERAAELGHAQAQYELAYAYEYACLGLEFAEPDLSLKWYRRAAESGNADAMIGLSGWYLTGLEGILAPDDSVAFEWCRRAAEDHRLPKAEYALGYYYEVGISVPADLRVAMAWYERAAAHGSRDAQFRLQKSDNATKLRKSEYGSVKVKKHSKGRECSIM